MLSLLVVAAGLVSPPRTESAPLKDLMARGTDSALLASSNADTLALEFLATLDEKVRSEAHLPFEDDYRTSWAFVPLQRRGAALGTMSQVQKAKATSLLRASLSDTGYRKIEEIRRLEAILFELENKNPIRNEGTYVFLVFGKPGPTGTWGWRYEGHHLSLNWTYQEDRLVASSPQFLGTNPAEVRDGPLKGKRVLAREEDLAFELLGSLTTKQLAKAVIGATAPADIVTGNQRKAAMQTSAGIRYSDLDERQRAALMAVIRAHAEVQTPEEQKRRMSRVVAESLVFGWMGATERGSGHYYRIQGSKFLIEYDNTQNNANHIHTAWRDFDGDFGADVLGEHYRHSHAHR